MARPPSKEIRRAADRVAAAMDSKFLKALAEPVRVELVKRMLVGGEADIGELAADLPQHRSVISRHLGVLHDAGLVQMRRDGRHRLYQLSPAVIVTNLEDMLAQVRRLIALCCPDDLPSS